MVTRSIPHILIDAKPRNVHFAFPARSQAQIMQSTVYLDRRGHPIRTGTVWTIYLLTDPYGVSYVGCAKRPLADRWRDHQTTYEQSPLHNAIRSCGAANFRLTVIAEALSASEARRKERHAIHDRGTLSPRGYNRILPK